MPISSKIAALSPIQVPSMLPNAYARQVTSLSDMVNGDGLTRKQYLKEETEAPFRKVRMFLIASLAISAGLGFLITGTSLLAVSQGIRNGDLDQLYQNLAINGAGIPVLGFLYKRELDQQNTRLERIKKGGALAGLKLRAWDSVSESPTVLKLSDLRRDRGFDRRVVIIAAERAQLMQSLESSLMDGSGEDNLAAADIMIVPLLLEKGNTSDGEDPFVITNAPLESLMPDVEEPQKLAHVAAPVQLTTWDTVFQSEVQNALKQTPDALERGITLVIKKNGKVGTRRLGVPIWEALVDDVKSREAAGLDVRNI